MPETTTNSEVNSAMDPRPRETIPNASPNLRVYVSRVPVPVLDHLHDPATLLPTAPDLSLNPPRTPVSQSSVTFSTPVPSLVLELDTTPLSLGLSEDEPKPKGYIRPGGNEPSGVNEQKLHSVASDQVFAACENTQARRGPWNVFGTFNADSRLLNLSKNSIIPNLPGKLRPNSTHRPISCENTQQTRSGLNRSQSARVPSSGASSLPPALSPPQTGPEPISRTVQGKKTRRVSAWLSPMKYDTDARELNVTETGKLQIKKSTPQDPTTETKVQEYKSEVKKVRRATLMSTLVSSWPGGSMSKSATTKTVPALADDSERASSTEDEKPNSPQSAESAEENLAKSAPNVIDAIDGSRSKRGRLFKRLRTIKLNQIW
ncbi:hypothetical protein CROQUDRAFT_519880 [Cronartium quercuum f. sp. fusiforme G11]|uniref:Uncharacterized protein n=1 Tax=Cronartium quercuum f. sp. fusiforme G11 TaxID=708437 RepID=A0A9P6NI29_9BASI|nr:hypothetical protein CROQUDRAFT_519880 [Cronartium quercuum f. sp. fusiforme G11]